MIVDQIEQSELSKEEKERKFRPTLSILTQFIPLSIVQGSTHLIKTMLDSDMLDLAKVFLDKLPDLKNE